MRWIRLVLVLFMAGCASHSGAIPAPNNVSPDIFQQHIVNGWATTVLKAINGEPAFPQGLAAGPNHKMWAAVDAGSTGAISLIRMDQKVTSYPISVQPNFIAFGSDQNLWVTTIGNPMPGTISRVTQTGVETDFTVAPGYLFGDIVNGPDNALWFPECSTDGKSGGIGRIDTSGSYVFYPGGCDQVLAVGSDENIWFGNGANVYSMTAQGVPLGTFPVGDSMFFGMTVGSDGAIYTTGNAADGTPNLIRVTTSGVVTNLGTDHDFDHPNAIVNGPDGNLWMTASYHRHSYLLTFNPRTQSFGPRTIAPNNSSDFLAVGPDLNLWVSKPFAASIDTYLLHAITLVPKKFMVPIGQSANVDASETNYAGQWTAVAKNPKIANVTPNSQNGTFVVTGESPGSTFVTVYDTMFNSASVKVTVSPIASRP
jgi:streptogramin lyase